MVCVANAPSSNSGPFRKSLFLATGCLCPRLGLGAAKNTRAMPVDPCRRDDIAAAVAARDSANPSAPLPRNTARLLAFMFASSDVCCLSQQAILLEGFGKSVSGTLRALAEVERGSARVPNTYQLHLPPVRP